MSDAETFFRTLIEEIEPHEVDVAVPMLRAHLDGATSAADQPSAVGFGIGGVAITPALVTGLSSAAVMALPLLRVLVDVVVPSIGAAADVASIRDAFKRSAPSTPEVSAPIENIPRMAHILERELIDAGLDPDRSSQVTLTCVKALLSDPEPAAALMSQLEHRG